MAAVFRNTKVNFYAALRLRAILNKYTKPEPRIQADAGTGTAESDVSVRVKARPPEAGRNLACPMMN